MTDAYREALAGLIAWAERLGGWEAPEWERAARLLGCLDEEGTTAPVACPRCAAPAPLLVEDTTRVREVIGERGGCLLLERAWRLDEAGATNARLSCPACGHEWEPPGDLVPV